MIGGLSMQFLRADLKLHTAYIFLSHSMKYLLQYKTNYINVILIYILQYIPACSLSSFSYITADIWMYNPIWLFVLYVINESKAAFA